MDHVVLVAIDMRRETMTYDYDEKPVQIPHREKRLGKLFAAFAAAGMLMDSKRKETPRFRIGDRVRMRYSGQEGTIVDINSSLCMVALANGRQVDSYEESQLEKAW